MGATSVTRSYTSIIATTLDKMRDVIEDQISSGNKLLYFYKKSGNFKGTNSLGDRLRIALMYELAGADSYSSFGQIDTTPPDGVTAAFFDWRQAASAISVSGLEEAQTRGTEAIQEILKTRTKQAIIGLEELFSKAMLQGQGSIDATSHTTARVSPVNGSSFIDPLPLLVHKAPASETVGGIAVASNAWWKNKYHDNAATTYAGFLGDLRNLHIDCSKGGGGSKAAPDFHVCDPNTFALYESALAAAHRNPSYQKADIPFDNILFKGAPVVWEEYVPDVKNADNTVGVTTDVGTWYMLNSNFIGVTFDKQHNFTAGEMVRPDNQDAKTSLVLWYGTHWVSNRRKHGVEFGISTSIAS